MPVEKATPATYQLKITLQGIFPPIWRRIQIPGSMKLPSLHKALQTVVGWTNTHLHQFEKGGKYWGVPEHDGFDDDMIDERRVTVAELLPAENDVLLYKYDFGDDWRHDVVLEKILPPEACTRPVCLAGARRCPPEDVGGPPGYQEFLEVIFEPNHREFSNLRGWAGGTFHAEEFDLEAINKALGRIRWPATR